MNKSGIYAIINVATGKCYIGSAISLNKRKNQHFNLLIKNKHYNTRLQNSFNKYGINNFEFVICEYVEYKEKLIEYEQRWINEIKSFERNIGYNLSPTAGSCLGFKHSEETKQKWSKMRSGKNHPCFGKTGEKSHWFGKRHSKETKQKMSMYSGEKSYMFGKHLSEETKNKLSIAFKGEKNPFYGKTHSQETLNKISQTKTINRENVGEKNPSAKLTWEKVKEIRNKYKIGNYTQNELSKEYKVTTPTIWKIIKNRTWNRII